MIKVVLFDFGGVIAEEGFREGLMEIAGKNNVDPDSFFLCSVEAMFVTGYLTGEGSESEFWEYLKVHTGIKGSNEELRNEILSRFLVRSEVIEIARQLKKSGYTTAILSDQTNWLEEIEENTPFFHEFDYVYNSYRIGKSKKDPSIFDDTALKLQVKKEEILFIDDNMGNIERASSKALDTIYLTNVESLINGLRERGML